MKPKLLLLTFVVAAIAGCESASDPYGVNSSGYYGSKLDSMQQNLIRPGSLGRQ